MLTCLKHQFMMENMEIQKHLARHANGRSFRVHKQSLIYSLQFCSVVLNSKKVWHASSHKEHRAPKIVFPEAYIVKDVTVKLGILTCGLMGIESLLKPLGASAKASVFQPRQLQLESNTNSTANKSLVKVEMFRFCPNQWGAGISVCNTIQFNSN